MSLRLNPRQLKIYELIEEMLNAEKPISPTVAQLGEHFGITQQAMSKNLKVLEEAGLIRRDPHKHRSIELVSPPPKAVSIQLLGRITAGLPLEQAETPESLDVPADLVPKGDVYALQVVGESMIEDGILDGDIVIIKRQGVAYDGQTIVAILNNEATLKRYYHEGSRVRLQPANSTMEPFYASPDDDFEIRGVVYALYRRFDVSHGGVA